MKRFFAFFLYLLWWCVAQSQELERVVGCVNSMFEKVQSASYLAEITLSEEDASHSFVQKAAYRKTAKKSRMPKFRIEHLDGEQLQYTLLYDQGNYTSIDHNSGTAYQYDNSDYKNFIRDVETDFLHPFMLPKKPFDLDDKRVKVELLADTLEDNVMCNRIRSVKRGKENGKEYIREEILVIDAANCHPIAKRVRTEYVNLSNIDKKTLLCNVRYLNFESNVQFADNRFVYEEDSSPYFLRLMSHSALKRQWKEQERAQSTFPYGNPAPAFELLSYKNELVNTSNLEGKVIVLAFFYSNCYPCLPMLQDLERLHRLYGAKGLEVIGVNPVDNPNDGFSLEEFRIRNSISYTLCWAQRKTVEQAYLVYSYPTIFIIDTKNRVCYSHQGYNDLFFSEVEKAVRKKLK